MRQRSAEGALTETHTACLAVTQQDYRVGLGLFFESEIPAPELCMCRRITHGDAVSMSKSEHIDLDSIDYQILKELCADGRASDVWLGEQINLSSTAVARRRKSLEERQAVLS